MDTEDCEEHARFVTVTAKACRLHLEDLRRHELWPEPIPNPDIDRLPVFRQD